MVLRVVFPVDGGFWSGGNHLQSRVSDNDRQAEGQVEHAALAAVLETGTCEADIGALLARCTVCLPAEDGEGTGALDELVSYSSHTDTMRTYNLAFGAVVLLQHLHVRVLGEAVLTHGWEIRRLPPGAV